ncbi:MAG: sulfatase [Candidatus Sumerlaeota bacterium]|nr:sulfatase [Candidatus Sumerlaeota bacterium]
MRRREFLGRMAGGAAALGLSNTMAAPVAPAPSADKPNVIIVFNDMMRRDSVGVYGGRNVATPNLDRLAAEGMMFTNAVSSCPLCTPYRGMLFTGQYPTHSGIVCNNVRAKGNQRGIAHVFAEAGYKTGLIGKFHLNYPRSVDYVPPGPQRLGFEHWEVFNFSTTFMNTPYCKDTPDVLHMKGYENDAEVDMAMRFIAEQKQAGRPFFLVVAPHPPHGPRNASNTPEEYLAGLPEKFEWPKNAEMRRGNANSARYYYAMVRGADANMGRLLAFLDEQDLAKNTIVIYSADHGDMFGSRGLEGKNLPYAESVDVPLFIRWPGRIAAGSQSDAPYTPIDHLTTLAGLLGFPRPETADGADLSSVLLGKGDNVRDAALMGNYTSSMSGFLTMKPKMEWRAVKTKQHTYVKWLDGSESLWDNLADPFQETNLAEDPASAALVEQLRSTLKDFLAKAHDDFRPGTGYAEWYDKNRNLLMTALGPV